MKYSLIKENLLVKEVGTYLLKRLNSSTGHEPRLSNALVQSHPLLIQLPGLIFMCIFLILMELCLLPQKICPHFGSSFPLEFFWRVIIKSINKSKHFGCTYTIIEGRSSFAVVGFMLFEKVNKVKDIMTLSTNKDIGLSHFLLCFCKLDIITWR